MGDKVKGEWVDPRSIKVGTVTSIGVLRNSATQVGSRSVCGTPVL